MEPPGAQDNYTERLVALAHLGCFYTPPDVVARDPDLDALGIGTHGPILLCPGVPFKYAPQHDRVFPAIAQRLGRCRFVFFTHRARGLSEKLAQRLRAAFARAQLDMDDFVAFIPWQNRAGFYGLLKRADVFLDTIGFSGFNTAIQAVECALPVVTREGRFLRGRLASGILKRMGLQELVAGSED
jgi:predicted O-linked N-acetylglucosamine transferase (SPINDLY family)